MYRRHPSHSPKSVGAILALIGVGALYITVMSGLVMLLWNFVMPKAMGASPIGFLHAFGLFVLFRILFGGIFFGRRRRSFYAKKKAWQEKWMGMSEEEREEFKSQWKQRCENKKEGGK